MGLKTERVWEKESKVEGEEGRGGGLIFKPTINWRQDVYGQS